MFVGIVMCCREESHVLRRALDFEDEGQRKKGRPKSTWKRQVEEESVKISLRREDTLCAQSEVLVFIRLLWGRGESGHLHLLGIL